MKMSRACPGMLSTENDDFKFLKIAKIFYWRYISEISKDLSRLLFLIICF